MTKTSDSTAVVHDVYGFGYADAGGVGVGVGGLDVRVEQEGGVAMTAEAASSRVNAGVWDDDASPAVGRFGLGAVAKLADVHVDAPVAGFSVQTLTAGATFTTTPDEFEAGFGANVVSAGVHVDLPAETRWAVGTGVGAGVTLRSHHGDADHNGVRSIGGGFDFEFASFDFQSELICRGLDSAAYLGNRVAESWREVEAQLGPLENIGPTDHDVAMKQRETPLLGPPHRW